MLRVSAIHRESGLCTDRSYKMASLSHVATTANQRSDIDATTLCVILWYTLDIEIGALPRCVSVAHERRSERLTPSRVRTRCPYPGTA